MIDRRAVFLDRDGVLNRALVRDGRPYPPPSAATMEILPSVRDSLDALQRAGFLLIVVTNQPDVAKGTQSREGVEAIHARLRAELPLDDVFVCYHQDSDACACRKPAPGMLHDAARRHQLYLPFCYMVGFPLARCGRGASGGLQVRSDRLRISGAPSDREPTVRVKCLQEAADWILADVPIEEQSMRVSDLRVKIFADGAEKAAMLGLYAKPWIRGFTTNPTLMRKAGIADYEGFARDILTAIPDRPISLEVFADEFDEMERQARCIASWGDNVYVKIPVTNTRRQPSLDLICRLTHAGVKLNVTAMMTLPQVRDVVAALRGGAPACVSVFAGRIADTGRDPLPIMSAALALIEDSPGVELIWASPRELLNVIQADQIGCHIITVTSDILKKLDMLEYDLSEYSLDTVKMFYNDAHQSGFTL